MIKRNISGQFSDEPKIKKWVDGDKVTCRVTWQKEPAWYVEGWAHTLMIRPDDESAQAPIFLKVYAGLPSVRIHKAFELIKESIGRIAQDRHVVTDAFVRIAKRHPFRRLNRKVKDAVAHDMIREVVPTLRTATPLMITEQRRIKSGRDNQPRVHHRHKVMPKEQIEGIIERGDIEKKGHSELTWDEIAINIEADVDDAREPGWIKCNPKKIADILRKKKTYLRQGHS